MTGLDAFNNGTAAYMTSSAAMGNDLRDAIFVVNPALQLRLSTNVTLRLTQLSHVVPGQARESGAKAAAVCHC